MTMRVLTIAVLLCTVLALSGATDTGNAKPVGRSQSRNGYRCPAGWSEFRSNCFLFVNQNKKWIDAEKYCIEWGGNLASVHSLQEYRFMQGLTAGHSFEYPITWIGGHDAIQEREWQWSDGSGFFYNHWNSGRPITNTGYNCLRMNVASSRGWEDYPCTYTFPFICSIKNQ